MRFKFGEKINSFKEADTLEIKNKGFSEQAVH